MLTSRSVLNAIKGLIGSTLIFSVCAPAIAFAQSTATEQNHPQSQSQHLATQPAETPPDVNRPPRTVHRIGTAIAAPRNSVSIKSTDAGAIPRQPATAGCI
ncbi:MAG: hypothetical protein EBU46_18675, partial [Nitrosomonadaceae bacterium]|nr:hypothetical protein [Nitrosomonadaceae bacterium]